MTTTKYISREDARFIWTDLEMSGLDPDSDKILEAAFIITDGNLKVLAQAPVWVVHQSEAVLNNMDAWNKRTHTESGLVLRCRHSKKNEVVVEKEILKFLKEHVKPGQSPMCGNSICQDRRFLARNMPKVERFFHYRNFDVSSFKIAAGLFAPSLLGRKKSPSLHHALDDILASITEMRHYVDNFLICDNAPSSRGNASAHNE